MAHTKPKNKRKKPYSKQYPSRGKRLTAAQAREKALKIKKRRIAGGSKTGKKKTGTSRTVGAVVVSQHPSLRKKKKR